MGVPALLFGEQLVDTVVAGKYRLVRLVGRGAFGAVYEAQETVAGQYVDSVAVKLCQPTDEDTLAALIREVRALAQLTHPGLIGYRFCDVVQGGPLSGCFLIVMELAEGSLEDVLLEADTISGDDTARCVRHIAQALAHLHERGAVHRDVKPANILWAGGRWKLGDTGLARAVERSMVTASHMVGTPAYMAPEVYEGMIGPASDVYSLGVTALESLTARLPHDASSPAELMLSVLTQDPTIPADLPLPWPDLLRDMLARDPDRRPPAEEVCRVLDEARLGPPPVPRTSAPVAPAHLDAVPATVREQSGRGDLGAAPGPGLIATGFGLSAFFLTVAFPLMLSGQPLAIGWAGQALALTIIGCWAKRRTFAFVGLGVLVLSACVLVWAEVAEERAGSLLGTDPQAAGLGLAVAVSLAMTVLHLWRRRELPWATDIANLSSALASVLALWLIAHELWIAFGEQNWWAHHTGEAWGLAVICAVALVAAADLVLGLLLDLSGLRWTSVSLGGLGMIAALMLSAATQGYDWPPFANLRACALALLAILCGCAAHVVKRHRAALTFEETDAYRPEAFGLAAALAALWGLTIETYHLVRWLQFPTPATWANAAQLAVSVMWAAYAAVALGVGIARRLGYVRWLALTVFAVAILKLFVYDLSFLTGPYRMLSFGALGLIMIGVALVYSRFGKTIREWASPDAGKLPPHREEEPHEKL